LALTCSAAAQETLATGYSPQPLQELAGPVPQAGNAQSAQDLGKNVTGVFVPVPVGLDGYAPEFIFRGFPNGGLALRDGAARGFLSGDIELAGIERTEFVKGVASLLYGTITSASGAAANYITKKPESDFFLRGDATIGSYDFYRGAFDLNTPLNDNKNVLLRLNVAAQNKGSFIDFVHSNSLYANPVLSITFDNGDRLSFRGEYGVGASLANYGLPPYLPSPIFLRLAPNFYSAVPANEYGRATQYDGSLTYQHDFNSDWSANVLADYLGAFQTFGWMTNWQYDGLRSIDLGYGARTHAFLKNFDLQASLKGKIDTGILTHNVFLGYERWSYYTRHRDRLTAYPLGLLDIFAPIYPSFVSYAFARPADGNDSGWTNSAFAQDAIDIGPQWRVLIGGRYDYLASYQTIDDPMGALTGTPGSTAGKGFKPNFSPRGGVLYRPTDDTSIHFGYARSFIPNLGVRLAGGKLAPPEEDTLYEIGVRQSLFDKKVDLDLGVFDVTRNHVPAPDPFNPTGFYSVVTGQQHSHGVEANANFQLLRNLRVGVAATILHALVTKDSNTPSQKGSDLLGAPRRVFNISATYSFDMSPLQGLELGASFYYASETQATLPNTRGFTVAPLKMLSVSASYKLSDHLSFSLRGSNLTNSKNFVANGVLEHGEPRTISASLSYRY
jgi:iron complex outermembrane receptor protein